VAFQVGFLTARIYIKNFDFVVIMGLVFFENLYCGLLVAVVQ